MTDDSLGLDETAWGQIRQTVHDEALRARVAASFLPLFGPLSGDTQAVPKNRLDYGENAADGSQPTHRLAVNDYETMRLTTVSVNVYLKNAQLADPELTSALIMFRRAADILARVEDTILFNGQAGTGKGPASMGGAHNNIPKVFSVSGGEKYPGLIDYGSSTANKITLPAMSKKSGTPSGQEVFEAVVDAIQNLEGQGHHGPFACVMGDGLFAAVTRPVAQSMVLPRDSIIPFLDAPLLRSSSVPSGSAVIVSLQGAPVEIVVPSDISVRFLQTTMESEQVFQVKQKFVLRVKDPAAVATISCS